jgi:tRNA (adenine-N(1)-)-methyltransferase non-catalytic subunit
MVLINYLLVLITMSAPEEVPVQETAVNLPAETTEKIVVQNMEATSTAGAAPTKDNTVKNGESSKPTPQPIPLSESLLQRVSTIKEGDNVLLRMPSDMVKAVVASKDG